MQYSEKFKSEMVSKMMGPAALSAKRLSDECGIGQPTLSTWLRKAKVAAVTKKPKPVGRKQWSAEEKMRVLLAATSAGDRGRGEVLRREGLHDADLVRFQTELTATAHAAQTRPAKCNAKDKKRIVELEREIRRKDKALAEAAALVVLSKKLQAYFGADEVGGTDEESEK